MRRNGWRPKNNDSVTKDNYISLLEDEYNGKYKWIEEYKDKNKDKLLIHCNTCNHEWEVSPYDMLKRGRECPICKDNKRKIDSFNEVKNTLIEWFGEIPYEFLSEFETKSKHMTVKCKTCGDIFKITPANMVNTKDGIPNHPVCKNCNIERIKNNNRSKENKYIDLINKEYGEYYTPLNIIKYKGVTKDRYFKCNTCGERIKTNEYNLYKVLKDSNGEKHYCPHCNNMVRDNRSYEDKLKDINPNIIPLEEYIDRQTKIKHKCLKCGHIWLSRPNSRYQNSGCPKCNNIVTESKMERELEEFIRSKYNGEIISNSRKLLGNNQEIDIYIPEYKIGIEMNGLYWHNEEKKDMKYHLNKLNLANEKGIHLIQIFEDEWNNKPDLVKSKILYQLKLSNNRKVYGRNTYVKEITSSKLKNDFLNENHIQGEDKSKIKLGLYTKDENELVAIMTFCNLRSALGYKDIDKNDYELSRYASKKDLSVIGGFSKLLKYFTNNYEYNKIMTYADLRWSSRLNNVYEKNNFVKLHESKPNYWYFSRNNVNIKYHRYNFRKNVLKDKLDNFDPTLTEYENMLNNNYLRIWDCGNMVFEYRVGDKK